MQSEPQTPNESHPACHPDVVLLGLPRHPLDEMPALVRAALGVQLPNDIQGLNICDLGEPLNDIGLPGQRAAYRELAQSILRKGKRLIVIAGDTDITYANVDLLQSIESDIAVLNFGARLRAGNRSGDREPATLRDLCDHGLLSPRALWQFGYLPAPEEERWLRTRGAHLFCPGAIWDRGMSQVLESVQVAVPAGAAMLWSLNLDAVNEMEAPGVAVPNDRGLEADEFLAVAEAAGRERRTCIVEIAGLAPHRDRRRRSIDLAAAAIAKYLLSLPAAA